MQNSLRTSPTLARVRALSTELNAAGALSDRQRHMPPELVEKLRQAGLFRMMVPRRYGGDELTISQGCAVIEELAAADGTAGWTAQIAFGFSIMLSKFERPVLDGIFDAGPDVKIRGAIGAVGSFTPVEGGYLVHGRFPFASGPFKPDWMFAGGILKKDGQLIAGIDGAPQIRMAIIAADHAAFHDNWHAMGLRGSDSRDFELDQVFVPESHVIAHHSHGDSRYDDPVLDLPFYVVSGPSHAAVCLGIVRGALVEIATIASGKRGPATAGAVLGDTPVFQHQLADLNARYAALWSLNEVMLQNIEGLTQAGQRGSPALLAQCGTWVAHIHARSVEIVNDIIGLAGGSAVYTDKYALQRRWRDARAVALHLTGSTMHYGAFGASLVRDPSRAGGTCLATPQPLVQTRDAAGSAVSDVFLATGARK